MSRVSVFLVPILLMAAPALADIVLDSHSLDATKSVAHPTGPSYRTGPIRVMTTEDLGIYGAGAFFDTFCIEVNEHINVPGRYDVSDVGPAAYNGGFTGGNPDDLSKEVAWLYRNYLDQTLALYVPTYLNTISDKASLQVAIWSLEGEWVDGQLHDVALNPTSMAWKLRESAIANSSSGDLRHVAVMNLDADGPSTTRAQSLLVSVNPPVPAPGAALLIGIGLACIGGLKRRSA